MSGPDTWLLAEGSCVSPRRADVALFDEAEYKKGILYRDFDGETPGSGLLAVAPRHAMNILSEGAAWIVMLLELPTCNVWIVCSWRYSECKSELLFDQVYVLHPSDTLRARIANILATGGLFPSPFKRLALVESADCVHTHPAIVPCIEKYGTDTDQDWPVQLMDLHKNEHITMEDIVHKYRGGAAP